MSCGSNFGACTSSADCCNGLTCKQDAISKTNGHYKTEGRCFDSYYLSGAQYYKSYDGAIVGFKFVGDGNGNVVGERNIIYGRSAAGGDLSDNKQETGLMNGMLIDPVIACGLVIIMILVCMIKRALFSTSN